MTEQIRAKFLLTDIHHIHTHNADEVMANVTLQPVIGVDSDDNTDWSKYTPNGKIEMTITNPAALEGLEVGAKYYIDITKA